MTDLFNNAKDYKFLVAPNYLTDHELLIILTDIKFWNEYYDDLDTWCRENRSQRQGMTVVLPDAETLTLFCLRWT
jgi:hypothetical protein